MKKPMSAEAANAWIILGVLGATVSVVLLVIALAGGR
jgi:hypothetical protein